MANFAEGLRPIAPHNAPDYIKMKLLIDKAQFIEWLQKQHGIQVSVDVKLSKNGNLYAVLDDWKPTTESKEKNVAKKSERNDLPF